MITGGAGFIGSAVVRQFIAQTNYTIVNVDKLTYAGNLSTLSGALKNSRHYFEQIDICDSHAIETLFTKFKPDAVMHLAAESHVDRSIDGSADFIHSNIIGTYTLLEATRNYWNQLQTEEQCLFRFHHVSTDEVFGSLGTSGLFHEQAPYAPNSPYSASKASSDHLVRAWYYTYGLPVLITNCSNNYGPYQYPEKLIPLIILNALDGKALPIYGKGDNIRDWLYVEDHAQALRLVLEEGRVGETYNIGGHNEKTNLEVVTTLCSLLDKLKPRPNSQPYSDLITFVEDRPGHDQRYAINASKLQHELGWQPTETFGSGIKKTIEWYIKHAAWWKQASSEYYQRERLGLQKQ